MGARKNRDARETHKGRGSSLPSRVSTSPMFPSCTPFFLTYYFQAPTKQARIHCVRIKLYSWFSQSEMDVTFFITAKLIPWFCDRCKHCSMTLKYAAALSLKGEKTKTVTKQHQQHNRPCLV